jgi:hypothetical protein
MGQFACRSIMENRRLTRATLLLLIWLAIFISTSLSFGEGKPSASWTAPDLPFRVMNVTSHGNSLWACGTNEGIAESSDSGAHWKVDRQIPDGDVLLNIQFAGEKFGYAAGTGGLLLTTEDGGQTWASRSAGNASILQISFADSQHGLIRTPESLLVTSDGGANWSSVQAGDKKETVTTFPYTFALVALDTQHMAVMLKRGSAQYEEQVFLISSDGGKSWRAVEIPSVTLYSFLRAQGKYWTVGTEVIQKDQPGGGHAVPVVLSSTDGEHWIHSNSDLSACKSEMCTACRPEGCFSANGMITNVFAENPAYRAFPPNPLLTPEWAANESAMCFVGSEMQCASITAVPQFSAGNGAVPPAISPAPLGNKLSGGPNCIRCEFDHFMVDKKIEGMYPIQLSLEIARNGVVTSAEATGAPSPEIKSRLEQEARQWIFDPYMKDGVAVQLRLNTKLQIAVVRAR